MYGLPYRREIAALRRSGLDRFTARYALAALLVERASSIVMEADVRGDDRHHDGVLERRAFEATAAARTALDALIAFHLVPAVGRLVDR
jgi:hypothetical protein